MTQVDALYINELCSELTQVEPNNFPNELKYHPFWLLWRAQHKATTADPLKIVKNPEHAMWQTERVFFKDLPSPTAHQAYGFLYNDEHPYVCIDIDMATPLNDRLVRELGSYTEWSPSSKGLHVIVSVDDKQKLIDTFGKGVRNVKEGRDLFIASGFVTITGRLVPFTKNQSIREYDADTLLAILRPYFSSTVISHPSVLANAKAQTDAQQAENADKALAKAKQYARLKPAQVRSLLQFIPVKCLSAYVFQDFPVLDPNCTEEARGPWLIVGQALHDFYKGGVQGFMQWQEWSKEGNKYDQDALEASWKSFSDTPSKITIATIIKLVNAQKPEFPDVNSTGALLNTIQNVMTFLDFYAVEIRYNTISANIEVILPKAISHPIGLPDGHKIASLGMAAEFVTSEMLKHGFTGSSIRQVIKAVLQTRATQNEYNPIVEYFQQTIAPWDGVDYIDQLMGTIHCSSTKRDYYKIFLRKWLIQVMAAVFSNSAKPNRLNNVLILQGVQGIGKTMWVEALFPPEIRAYCVGSKSIKMSSFRTDMVKLNMELTSTLICNVNEIDTVFNSKTYSDFKAFLDQTVDKIVLPYGDAAVDVVRRTVFIGSTNKTNFFSDETGNRRFTLIQANEFDYKHTVNLPQLWAQVYHLYKKGEVWWLDENSTQDTIAIKAQAIANSVAMDMGDDRLVDALDNLFDVDMPLHSWQEYSFQQVLALLNMSINGADKSYAKRTITLWLRSIPGAREPYLKHSGKRAPLVYLMPPLIGTGD